MKTLCQPKKLLLRGKSQKSLLRKKGKKKRPHPRGKNHHAQKKNCPALARRDSDGPATEKGWTYPNWGHSSVLIDTRVGPTFCVEGGKGEGEPGADKAGSGKG